MTALVVLTPEELRSLIREAVAEAMRSPPAKPENAPDITEEEIARARRSLRRFGRGGT